MTVANLSLPDLIGALVGFALTLLVFSYLLGDNPLFRLTIHIFIGVSAGFAAVIAWYNVIWPQLILPILGGSRSERLFLIVPLVLAGLLLTKVSARIAVFGNGSMAYLVGVGVATLVGGAVMGTLFPQIGASINLYDQENLFGGLGFIPRLFENSLILVGTLATLIYFQFSARPQPGQTPKRSLLVEGTAWIGQIFIAVALGSLFAGVYTSALTALIERLQFIVGFLLPLITPR